VTQPRFTEIPESALFDDPEEPDDEDEDEDDSEDDEE